MNIDEMSVHEIIEELLDRARNTNGFEFTTDEAVAELIAILQSHRT